MIQATENLPFGNLLLQRFPLVIPKYQRAYAWDDEELDDFIRDITELHDMRVNNPGKQMPHFFGGIVSVKRTAGGTYSGSEYDIVDGQQRLTTITLALNALLAGFAEIALVATANNESDLAKAANAHSDVIHNKYIVYPEVEGPLVTHRHRITLSKADDKFFKQIIDNAGNARTQNTFERDSHRRIQEAWSRIYTKLIRNPILDNTSLQTGDKINHLLAVHSCLTEDCYVIHIISDNHQEAYRLFSILNDRGKNLSDGDLLRSYTLESLEGHVNQQTQTEDAWDKILSYKDLQIDQFLRAYYPSHMGQRAPKRDLANIYRTTFFKYSTPPQTSDANQIQNRVLEMKREAIAFAEISEGRWPYQNTILSAWDRDRLQKLVKTLKHTICMPLLLSAYACLPETQFAEIVSLLERFSFRYITIVGSHAGKLGNVYNAQSKAIRLSGGNYNVSLLQAQLQKLQITNAKDTSFENDLLDQLNYDTQSMRVVIRYFLSTIEDYYAWYLNGSNGKLKPDKTRVFDINTLTIEHVHAQNPQAADPQLDPKVHMIGNLSFWGATDNQAAGNSPFGTKKARYQQSSIALNRELAKLPNWDINQFNNRQKLLVAIALKIFSA